MDEKLTAPQLSIYSKLYGEYKFITVLLQIAKEVSANYEYFHLHDAQPITLFDFDIIYGGLLSMSRGIAPMSSRYGECYDILSLLPAIGPGQLRHLLANVSYYTLPPGAEAELYTWTKRIYGKLDDRAEHFLTNLKAAQKHTDPVGYLLQSKTGSTDVVKLLQTEIGDLNLLVSDAKLLNLMREKWIPGAELLGSQDEASSIMAYKVVLKTLAVQRNKEDNNYRDALNAQFAVKIFNTFGHYNGGRAVPTLISGTEPIATLDVTRWLKAPHYELKPKLFASVLYFRLTQVLAAQSDGSNRQIAHLADEMFGNCLRLCNAYKEALSVIKTKCPSLDDDCIAANIEVQHYLRVLHHIKFEFGEEYEQPFRLDAQSAITDKVSLVNQMLSSAVSAKLLSRNLPKIKEAISEITKKVRVGEATAERIFWNETSEVYVLKDDLPSTAFELASFDLTVSHSEEETLFFTKPCEPINNIVGHDWEENPTLVVNVHPKLVNGYAILQVVATRTSQTEHQFKIRWCHNEDFYTLMHSAQLIPSIFSTASDAEFKMEIKGVKLLQSHSGNGPEDFILFVERAITLLPEIVEATVSGQDFNLNMQFEPLNGVEFQASLIVPELADDSAVSKIAKLISDQMSEPKLNRRSIYNLLKLIHSKLLTLDFDPID